MKESEAWLMQSKSDWESARRILSEEDHLTYCQSIAKCQQTVEKAVKALVAALRETSIATLTIGWKHDVARFTSAFRRLSMKQPTDVRRGIVFSIQGLFSDEDVDSGIRFLDSVFPRAPAEGELAKRNTEYPFHAEDGSFRAPAGKGVFTLGDARRCYKIATRVYIGCSKIASALKRI